MNMLIDINRNGTTVVVVTHDKELVDSIKKRVILLNNGQIARDTERSMYSEAPIF